MWLRSSPFRDPGPQQLHELKWVEQQAVVLRATRGLRRFSNLGNRERTALRRGHALVRQGDPNYFGEVTAQRRKHCVRGISCSTGIAGSGSHRDQNMIEGSVSDSET